MRYTLDHYCCFNWYHWILSIGINIDIFVYSYIFVYVCLHFKEYQFQLVLPFHTYICVFVYTKAWVLILFQLTSFQLVSIYKLIHCFIWYFIKGEKTCISSFNWYLIFTPILYDWLFPFGIICSKWKTFTIGIKICV